jgi:N6-L-threonylcarbamoyladenine synthase
VASVVVGGGVSLNQSLRKQCQALSKVLGIPMIFPPAWACTDNAAMIAIVGYLKYQEGEFANASVTASSRLKI